jgi:hypothetical protein
MLFWIVVGLLASQLIGNAVMGLMWLLDKDFRKETDKDYEREPNSHFFTWQFMAATWPYTVGLIIAQAYARWRFRRWRKRMLKRIMALAELADRVSERKEGEKTCMDIAKELEQNSEAWM